MIIFNEKKIDENSLFALASTSFITAATNLLAEDPVEYKSFFSEFSPDELSVSLARIAYSKNFEIEDFFYFDGSTDFHFYVLLYVFGERDEKECLGTYTLMLNENLESVDDFIRK